MAHALNADSPNNRVSGVSHQESRMPMTPERIAERVDLLIDSIRGAQSSAFAEHNAAQALEYIEQLYNLGKINGEQFSTLIIAVNDAADAWQASADQGGRWQDC